MKEDLRTADGALIELDSRRRASLGKVALPHHERYLARVDADGTITLTPAVVMTEMEARLHANPELMTQIKAQRENLGDYRERPSR